MGDVIAILRHARAVHAKGGHEGKEEKQTTEVPSRGRKATAAESDPLPPPLSPSPPPARRPGRTVVAPANKTNRC